MYRNDGGGEIQAKLKARLEERGHHVINDFDMRECWVASGKVYAPGGACLSDLDLLYHMNADESTPYQVEVLQAIERSGVRVVNSAAAYLRCKDKFVANAILRRHGISVPPSALVSSQEVKRVMPRLFEDFGSLVLKPRTNHGGKGIIKFESLGTFMDFFEATEGFYESFYVEKFIDFGITDYRVEVLNGEAVSGYSRTRTHSFKTNVSARGLMTPTLPKPEHLDLARQAAKVLDIEFTIVDLIEAQADGVSTILEVNPIMGIFLEAGIRDAKKSLVREIHPYFETDQLKLDRLVEFLCSALSSS